MNIFLLIDVVPFLVLVHLYLLGSVDKRQIYDTLFYITVHVLL